MSYQFVILDKYGKKMCRKCYRGALIIRLHNRPWSVTQKIFGYLHCTGSHGIRKASSRRAEQRLLKAKRNL